MKKLVITIMAIIGVAVAYADNTAGSFLTFERADGSTTSVAVGSGITLNISNGSMTVGDETISVADLNKMFFTVQASVRWDGRPSAHHNHWTLLLSVDLLPIRHSSTRLQALYPSVN